MWHGHVFSALTNMCLTGVLTCYNNNERQANSIDKLEYTGYAMKSDANLMVYSWHPSTDYPINKLCMLTCDDKKCDWTLATISSVHSQSACMELSSNSRQTIYLMHLTLQDFTSRSLTKFHVISYVKNVWWTMKGARRALSTTRIPKEVIMSASAKLALELDSHTNTFWSLILGGMHAK